MKKYAEAFDLVDYSKYLKCIDCQDSGLYCAIHKIEVENILDKYYTKRR